MNCKNCGKEINNSWKFCIYCGTIIENNLLVENNIKHPIIINPEDKKNSILKFVLASLVVTTGLSLIIYLIYLFTINNS